MRLLPLHFLSGIIAGLLVALVMLWYRRRVQRRRDDRVDMRFPRCLVCGLAATVTSQGNKGFPDGPYCALHSPAWREPRKDATP